MTLKTARQILSAFCCMGALVCGADSLWNDFVAPPDAARPWCYWGWLNGHADRETITADLEAMKRLGFGGVLMFDSRGYFDDDDHVVNPKAEIVPSVGANGQEARCPRVSLTNSWHVSFAYHDGMVAPPPAPMTMETLCGWTTYGTDGDATSTSLRYFSGTATYRTTIVGNGEWGTGNGICKLSLGHVPTGLAHVFVNGVDCGVAWCAPWEVDISSAVRPGANDIEIRYTNNWYNRLVGDCFLPENERVTCSTLRYWRHARKNAADKDPSHRRTRYSGPSADDPLQPSGILGPVTINLP